ncbi:hypothetical protein PPSIR1_29690 [Plesiocystis pacifica SIR-1]|uniref:Outer membrane beta-barrel domain-containing protein n=2 Tax=Plesiocystis pacifica TaxID=191768 RepID=A6GIB9_9BACT|nr:hypothetical protein PPSIR1_29690 [Plesiocystis pacifica SIR-1]
MEAGVMTASRSLSAFALVALFAGRAQAAAPAPEAGPAEGVVEAPEPEPEPESESKEEKAEPEASPGSGFAPAGGTKADPGEGPPPANPEPANPRVEPPVDPWADDPAAAKDFDTPGAPAKPGGFGSVDSVEVESTVRDDPAPAPSASGEDEEHRDELSVRAELGYVQSNLRNLEGFDHHGAYLRLLAAVYPWTDARHRAGIGLGLAYTYAGFNGTLPNANAEARDRSAFTHMGTVTLDTFVRPDPKWFTIQPSGHIGLTVFDVESELWIGDQVSWVSTPYFFVAGGAVALCTLWDIVCATGGSEYMVDVRLEPVPVEGLPAGDFERVSPFTWHVGFGLDILRMLSVLDQVPGLD